MPEGTTQTQDGQTQQTTQTQNTDASQSTQQTVSGTNNGTQQPAQTNPDGTPRTGAQSGFQYPEDRSKWIPPHRFNEVNTQAQRARELETQLATTRSQIAALTGSQPSDANTQKAEQVKEAFFNLPGMGVFRKFATLSDEQIDKLLKVPDQIEHTTQNEQRAWQRHGNEQITYIASGVAEALGSEALDEDQQYDLRVAFKSWITKKGQAEIDTTGNSPSLSRYEQGDKKLLDEFVTAYTKRWVEPARRQNAASVQSRVRQVPSSAGRSQVSTVQRPTEFKSLDERIEYAAKLATERGAQFGR